MKEKCRRIGFQVGVTILAPIPSLRKFANGALYAAQEGRGRSNLRTGSMEEDRGLLLGSYEAPETLSGAIEVD